LILIKLWDRGASKNNHLEKRIVAKLTANGGKILAIQFASSGIML